MCRPTIDTSDGLWSVDSFIALSEDAADRVTMSEGMTPLADAPAWSAQSKLE